jgi:heterotetrameric sarcosine oxidase gamma subunit
VGKVAYTLMLNERGGIESDITVARFADDKFLLMSSMARTRRDLLWLENHMLPQEEVRLQDATSAYGVLSIVGPKSRELVANLTNTDMSNTAFPFGTWQNLYLGHAPCWAQRVSFTGELGWEIYVTPDFADYVLQLFLDNGQELGLRLMGGEALNALRIEKGYLHWGHDLSYTDAPHQLGLEFLCKTDKTQGFLGQAAFEKRRAEAKGPHLCHLTLTDSQPMLHHNEAVLRDGGIVGFVTSGAYAQHSQRSVGLCVLQLPQGTTNKQCIEDGSYTVLIEGQEYAANVSLKSSFDPRHQKLR